MTALETPVNRNTNDRKSRAFISSFKQYEWHTPSGSGRFGGWLLPVLEFATTLRWRKSTRGKSSSGTARTLSLPNPLVAGVLVVLVVCEMVLRAPGIAASYQHTKMESDSSLCGSIHRQSHQRY